MVLGGPAVPGVLVVLVDEQPLSLDPAAVRPRRTSANRPASFSPVEVEVQLACARWRAAGSSVCAGRPGAAVPDDHVAPAVLAARDDALEVGVLQRVVLDVHGELPGRGVERRAAGHRPAGQHAVDLEPEVVVQPPGAVALDDEPPSPALGRGTRRLGGHVEVALRAVLPQLLPARVTFPWHAE